MLREDWLGSLGLVALSGDNSPFRHEPELDSQSLTYDGHYKATCLPFRSTITTSGEQGGVEVIFAASTLVDVLRCHVT